jgi:hypothetical protein
MWEFRYLKGIRIAPRAALTVGSAVDHAVSVNLQQKIQSDQDLPVADALDAYSDQFDELARGTDWREDAPGKQKDVGASLVEAHHREIAPLVRPAAVQETITVETDAGYDLGGTIDVVERSDVIVDTKTSRLAYAEDAPKRALQPALYDFLFEATRGRPSRGFRYDVLVKPTTRTPARTQQVSARIDHGDRGWLFGTIGQVHKAIQAGVAMPAPEGSWYCSREWCGYWDLCKGKRK